MSTSAAAAPAQPTAARLWHGQAGIGTLVVLGVIAMAALIARSDTPTAALWLLGAAAGFTLQRARFCFASAFRDIFLFGSARIMNGVLVGLAVASVGFALVMHDMLPRAGLGIFPPEAHVLPVGLTTVVGGLLFGIGMVLSGGCVSGSLYRMAEGYVGSWVSIAGVMAGLGLLSHTWDWWYRTFMQFEPRLWLPGTLGLGYGGGVVVTLAGLLGAFLLFAWWQGRSGMVGGGAHAGGDASQPTSARGALSAAWQTVFVRGWPAVVGGAVLGGIVVLMYVVHMPWGVTGELTRWSNALMDGMRIGAPELAGAAEIGGCAVRAGDSGVFAHTFAVTVGLLPGALAGALFSREFKLRFPRGGKRYVQSLGGGLIMGYGSGLAVGCTIGAFFSSIPSLSVSGWLFAVALAGGAFVGVRLLRRIG